MRFILLLLIPVTLAFPADYSVSQQLEKPNHGKPRLNRQELEKRLRAKLDETVKSYSFPGATLGVVLPDGTTISLAAGHQDLDQKVPLVPTAKMFCGSTGKTFVAAAVFLLIEQERISLDDDAQKFFSEKEDRWFHQLPNSNSIRIRNLLNHTSGLPRYIFQPKFLNSLKQDRFKARSPIECLSVLRGQPPVHKVGERFAYSDSNYLVLGLIIEKLTGQSFYDFVQQKIMVPHSLKQTVPATQAKLPGLAQGHVGRINPFQLPPTTVKNGKYVMNPGFEWCGGGYITTTTDLAKWMQALHNGKVLNHNSYRQMVATSSLKTGLPGNAEYGCGTFVWKTDQGHFYGHAGMMPGYLTQIEHSARHGFSIAFQTNTDEGLGRSHHRIVQDFAAILINAQSPPHGNPRLRLKSTAEKVQ